MLGMGARGRGLPSASVGGGVRGSAGAGSAPAEPPTLGQIGAMLLQKLKGGNARQVPNALSIQEKIDKLMRDDAELQRNEDITKDLMKNKIQSNPDARIDLERQQLSLIRGKRATLVQQMTQLGNLSMAIDIQRETYEFMRTMRDGVKQLNREKELAKQEAGLDVDDIATEHDDAVADAVDLGRESISAFTEASAVQSFYGGISEREGGSTVGEQIDDEIESMRRKVRDQADAGVDADILNLKTALPAIPSPSPGPASLRSSTSTMPTAFATTASGSSQPSQKNVGWLLGGSNW